MRCFWTAADPTLRKGLTVKSMLTCTGAVIPTILHLESAVFLQQDREREGRCATCGILTHEFEFDSLTGLYLKIPLHVPDEVLRGRCLLCYPISGANQGRDYADIKPAIPTADTNERLPLRTFENQRNSKGNALSHVVDKISQCLPPPPTPTRRVPQSNREMLLLSPVSSGYSHFKAGRSDENPVRGVQRSYSSGADIVDILALMKRHLDDGYVQERCGEQLWIMSWDDDNAIAIGRVGGIPLILQAMRRFPHRAQLQWCACETIQNLVAATSTVFPASALIQRSESPQLINQDLGFYTVGMRYNCEQVVHSGGVELVVKAMLQHPYVTAIQQSGCTALASLAMYDGPDHQNYRYVMNQCIDMYQAIIQAGCNFHNDECVFLAAQDALRSLIGHDAVDHVLPAFNRHNDRMMMSSPLPSLIQEDDKHQHAASQTFRAYLKYYNRLLHLPQVNSTNACVSPVRIEPLEDDDEAMEV
jgi:hypothetical protein